MHTIKKNMQEGKKYAESRGGGGGGGEKKKRKRKEKKNEIRTGLFDLEHLLHNDSREPHEKTRSHF